MTIQIYPTSPIPYRILIFSEEYQTLISEFTGQNEQALMLRRFPKRTIQVQYQNIFLDSQWYLIENFFKARKGQYEAFWFLDLIQRKWTDEYVGRGTGEALTLDLHSKTTVAGTYVIYEDGVAQIEDTDYTFGSGGGLAGVDRITWKSSHYPALGALITANHKGYLRIKARMDDRFSDEFTMPTIGSIKTITLREVQW
jgi:hypothetical protein